MGETILGSLLLIGAALFLADVLPDNVQRLLLAAGVATLLGGGRWRVRRDPGADYPYPTQEDTSSRRRR